MQSWKPRLDLDHLAIVAPTLAEGVAHVEACLGLIMPEGGRHREMGTRNHLLRLGDRTFLEVIAVDPDAPEPGRRRWFNLDDVARVRADWGSGRRLRGWVARTDDLDGALSRNPGLFGEAIRVTRGDLAWHFAVRPDGSWPEDGAAPCLMDWGGRVHPATTMRDLGARLRAFMVEHPEPDRIAALYTTIGVADRPIVHAGAELRYRAEIETPHGTRSLF